MKKVRVVAGILFLDECVLAAQRGSNMRNPGKWEFPGGKVEKGEDDASALVRELQEELSIKVEVQQPFIETTYAYPDQTICLVGLIGRIIEGEPIVSEHQCIKWVPIPLLNELDWSSADIPMVQALMERK